MNASTPESPTLAEHFVSASLLGLLKRRHPYDFIETYEILRRLYGYGLDYVNLGLWSDGPDTVEPGQRLAFRVLDALELGAGAHLVEAGSGLGQAAVDACRRYELASVRGINPNQRQVAYARALAEHAGLGSRIEHEIGDACERIGTLPPESVSGIAAIECIGHFREPTRFLEGARQALVPGGRLALTLNVSAKPLSAFQRGVARASYGFVPQALERWKQRIAAAGFEEVTTQDLTELVSLPMTERAMAGLDTPYGKSLPTMTRQVMRVQTRFTRAAIDAGQLRYALVVARRN